MKNEIIENSGIKIMFNSIIFVQTEEVKMSNVNNDWIISRIKKIKDYQVEENKSREIVAGTASTTLKTYSVAIFSETDPKNLQVFKINIKDLLFNYDNGRLTKYISKYIEELKQKGQKLDYTNREHQERIRHMLIESKSYSSKSSGDLKQNFLDIGHQKEPIIVTQDGIIWNGNRRTAIRYELAKNDPKWEIVEAVILPEMSLLQLQDLETRLQRVSDYKEEYGDVNECLNIRKRLLDKNIIKDWQNPTDDEEKLMKTAFPKLKTWSAIKEKKKLADLLDDYLNVIKKDPMNYDSLQDESGGLTYFENILKLLNIEEGSTDPVEFEAIKWELLVGSKKPKKVHKNIRLLNQAFQKNGTLKDEFLENGKIYQKIISTKNTEFLKGLSSKDIEDSYSNLQTVASAYEKSTNDPRIEFESFDDFLKDVTAKMLPLDDTEFIDTLNSILEKIEKLKSTKQ